MKTVSAGLATHLGLSSTSLATCWKLTRTDGTIFGFTDHDQDIDFDLGDGDGTVTYVATIGYIRTAIKSTSNFSIDNLDVIGALDAAGITQADIDAGRYDNAEIKVFIVNWEDLTQGALKLRVGTVGDAKTSDLLFTDQLRGLIQFYAQEIVEVSTPHCRADLGDSRCGVRLEPPNWAPSTAYTVRSARDASTGSVVRPTDDSGSGFNDRHFKCITAGTSGGTEPTWNLTIGGTTNDGTVVWETIRALTIETEVSSDSGAITDNGQFVVAYTGDAPDALLTGGLVTWTSGLNNGLKMEVKTWTLSSKEVKLFLPMPFAVQAGDTLKIQAGCDKSLAVCRNTFDNIFNFRGEPHVPGNDLILRTPNAR